jgi:MFS family permease
MVTHAKAPTPGNELPYPPRARLWYAVAIFFVASVISIMDRQILFLVVDPIRSELGISDVQISLLEGAAFSIFYAAFGLPLGLIADRGSRKWLMVGGVSIWSAATIFAGLAQNFEQLFFARALVGVGEASLTPAVVSMVGDLASPDRRGRPISVYLMGQALGKGATVSMVGFLLAAIPTGLYLGVPLLEELAPWRAAFCSCGLLGILVVGLLLTVREPVRREAAVGQPRVTAMEIGRFLLSNRRLYIPAFLAHAILSIGNYGLAAWGPTILSRSFGMSSAEIGLWLGSMLMVTGVAGSFLGGIVTDRAARSAGAQTRLKLLSLACLAFVPGMLTGFAPNAGIAIVLIGMSAMIFPAIGTMHVSTVQDIVPGSMRGVAMSLIALLGTLVGFSVGPFVIAIVTQHVFRDPAAVGSALATVTVPALVLSAWLYRFAGAALPSASHNIRLKNNPGSPVPGGKSV